MPFSTASGVAGVVSNKSGVAAWTCMTLPSAAHRGRIQKRNLRDEVIRASFHKIV
ncbi:hypothetical protein D3C80_1252830 [compost metagenome]